MIGEAAKHEILQQLTWNAALLLRLGIPAVLAAVFFLAGQRWAIHQMRSNGHWHAWIDEETSTRFSVLAARNAELVERLKNRQKQIVKLERVNGTMKARHQAMVAASGIGGS